eukprot:NODE_460_length_8176_cov_0.585737.p5 type:complete len:116 gc:universal NODE_460_length_8176_cov_0.585737:1318-971(-)
MFNHTQGFGKQYFQLFRNSFPWIAISIDLLLNFGNWNVCDSPSCFGCFFNYVNHITKCFGVTSNLYLGIFTLWVVNTLSHKLADRSQISERDCSVFSSNKCSCMFCMIKANEWGV